MFPDFVDFCVTDGVRLVFAPTVETRAANEDTEPITAEVRDTPVDEGETETIVGRARLFSRVHGETNRDDGIEFFGDVVIGQFDAEVGVVDVDLGEFEGSEYISPRHAKLRFEDGKWWIEDLGSKNGVFINRGERITEPTQIKTGDEIGLGNALFVFESDGTEESYDSGEEEEEAPEKA